MVNYSLNFIRLLLTNEARTVDVKHEAEVAYTVEMQRALKNTVWQSGCTSWYVTGNGWNSVVYPYTQVDFWRRCKIVKWSDWNIEYTAKGLAKIRMRKVRRVLAFMLAIGVFWRFRSSGWGLGDLKGLVMTAVRIYMANVMQLGDKVKNAVSQ